MIRKALVMTYAVTAWVAGTSSLFAMILFLSGRLPAFSIDGGTPRASGAAILIDSALLGQWTLQHVGMARHGFKQWLKRWFPEALERSNYVLFTGASLWLVLLAWSPMPARLFAVTHPVASFGIWAVFVAAWALVLAGIFYDSYPEFVGLRQAWCHVRGKPHAAARFRTGFVFRLCRRPTFLGIIIGCWATTTMTAGHALFAAGMTACTLIGCQFVEQTYLRLYGAAYRDYQASTPLLLPGLGLLRRRDRERGDTARS